MNDFNEVMDRLMALSTITLREYAAIVGLVNHDYARQSGVVGSDTVYVTIASGVKTRDVTPGPYSIQPDPVKPYAVPVVMSNWREAPIAVTDKEVSEIGSNVMPNLIQEGIASLVADIATSIYLNYKYLYAQTGTIGTELFSDKTTDDAADMSESLAVELCPPRDRFSIMDTRTERNAQTVPNWLNVNQSGDDITMRTGMLGFKSNAQWASDQLMPQHTNGNMGSGTIIKAATAHPVGAQVLTVTGGTGGWTANEGDVFKITGDPLNYVVRNPGGVTINGGADGQVTVNPGLRVALTGGEVLALEGGDDVTYNIGCIQAHRDCFAFASKNTQEMDIRRLFGAELSVPRGDRIDRVIQDSVTGIALRFVAVTEHYQSYLSVSSCWGSAVPLPQLGNRAIY